MLPKINKLKMCLEGKAWAEGFILCGMLFSLVLSQPHKLCSSALITPSLTGMDVISVAQNNGLSLDSEMCSN